MKRKLVVGIVAGVLVLALGVIGAVAFSTQQKANTRETAAKVASASQAVDDKFDAIWKRLEGRDEAWDKGEDYGVALAQTVNLTKDDVAKVRAELSKARELIAEIPDEDVRKAYVAVCDELETTFKGVPDEMAALDSLSKAYGLLDSADQYDSGGSYAINEAIKAGNEERFDDVTQYTTSAKADFQKMRDAYVEAASVSNVEAVAAACAYSDTELQVCDLQFQLASLGAKGSVNKYNQIVNQVNSLQDQASAQAQLIADARAALFAESRKLFKPLVGRADEAKQLWDDAKKAAAAASA